jgi:hypothetical protein
MGNLADEMSRKTEEANKGIQRSNKEFKKREEMRFNKVNENAVEKANELFTKVIDEIDQKAKLGKNVMEFMVASYDSPSKDEEEKLPLVAIHLANLLRKRGFITRAISNISEEYVDSPRRIYVAVEINW